MEGTQIITQPRIPAKLIIGDQEIDVFLEEHSHEKNEIRYDRFGESILQSIYCKDTFICTRESTKYM